VSQSCIVADAGPLIGLARIGRLDLLHSLFDATILPHAVYAECVRAPDKPGGVAIAKAVEAGWLAWRSPSKPAPSDFPASLGQGESDAIVLALELKCLILLDDKLARGAARAAGLSVIGTGGLLLAAKAHNLVPSVAPLLEQLRAAGYHLSDELLGRILELAGEAR
jgi:predicted nucleic acid-binding protein